GFARRGEDCVHSAGGDLLLRQAPRSSSGRRLPHGGAVAEERGVLVGVRGGGAGRTREPAAHAHAPSRELAARGAGGSGGVWALVEHGCHRRRVLLRLGKRGRRVDGAEAATWSTRGRPRAFDR
ncbi:unnamed protein product, partial [Ectocarpus sp. 13 AM-2016]